jgi:hypothetical protein
MITPKITAFQHHPLSEMDIRLNMLCHLCKQMHFEVRSVLKPDEGPEVHPREFQHAQNLDALNKSALNGCHLCSLFAAGLRLCRPLDIGNGEELYASNQGHRVTVKYIRSYASYKIYEYGERLEIRCGNMWVPLYLESLPSGNCSVCGELECRCKVLADRAEREGTLSPSQGSTSLQLRDITDSLCKLTDPGAKLQYANFSKHLLGPGMASGRELFVFTSRYRTRMRILCQTQLSDRLEAG